MKTLTKLTLALAGFATLGTTAFAGPTWYPTPPNVKPRPLATPVAELKCDRMQINGGGRNGMVMVRCKDFAKVRPTECRLACAR